MKSIKQIEQDPRVLQVERNPDWSPKEAKDYPNFHPTKYLLWLKDGWVFDDPVSSHINGADSVRELNELLDGIIEEGRTEE